MWGACCVQRILEQNKQKLYLYINVYEILVSYTVVEENLASTGS